MPEPITLALIGGAAITEGIKFLYNQSDEILKRWWARKDKKPEKEPGETETISIQLPEVFEGKWSNLQLDFEAVKKAEKQLDTLRRDMLNYVDGLKAIDVTDEHFVKKVDLFRQLIEAVYQQRLTFKGESRPSSGPIINAKIDVEEILGRATVLDSDDMTRGEVHAEAKAKSVGPGGELTVVNIKKIGG